MAAGQEVAGRELEAPIAGPAGHTIVTQVKWVGIGHVVSQASWYAVYLFLAARLPPAAFGTVAAGMAIVGVAQLLMESGTGGSLIAARELTRAQVRRAFVLNVAIGLALTGLIALAAGPLTAAVAQGADADIVRVLGIGISLVALTVVPDALLRKAMAFKLVTAATVVATLATAAAALIGILLGAGVWALVLRQLVLNGVTGVLLWTWARGLLRALPEGHEEDRRRAGPPQQLSFLVVSASVLVALTLDNVIVGATTGATQLGFYALAFALAFAPLTQVAWQFGRVLFPAAAATRDLVAVGERTVRVVRLTALVLLPFVPPAIVLAAPLVPAVLGSEWEPMVTPLRILIVVGVAHAVLTTIGESLAGAGHMPYRARTEGAWAIGTLVAVFLLARARGIDGAALAHLLLVLALGAAWIGGARRIGTTPGALLRALRDIVLAVAAQGVVTLAALAVLGDADGLGTAAVASVLGLAAGIALLHVAPSRPVAEARAMLADLRAQGARDDDG